MWKLLIPALALGSSVASATVYEVNLFQTDFADGVKGDFFQDYRPFSHCTVEVDPPLPSQPRYVDITDPAFKRLECTIPGSDGAYTFSYGENVPVDDDWSGNRINGARLGLLFDSSGKPLRFDAPDISSQSSSYGFYDSEEPGTGGFSTHSFWGPSDNDGYNTPAAVLLQPAVVFGTLRPRGYMTSAANVPPGASAALINGTFVFQEQWLRDVDRSAIPAPLNVSSYYSFDEQLTVPKVRVTQAVFQKDSAIAKLAENRTTAILVDKGKAWNDRRVELKITDITNAASPIVVLERDETHFVPGPEGQLLYSCDSTNGYCGLRNDRTYEFAAYPQGTPYFDDVKRAQLKTTKDLRLEFMFLRPPGCSLTSATSCEGVTASALQATAAESVSFIQKTFPLRDGGVDADANDIPTFRSIANSNMPRRSLRSASGVDAAIVETQFTLDIFNAFRMSMGLHRQRIVFVPPSYLPSVGFGPNECGAQKLGVAFVNVGASQNTVAQTTAHEVGHTLGLYNDKEAYAPPHYPGPDTSGFDVYEQANIEGAVSFMGACKSGQKYWAYDPDWRALVSERSGDARDPDILGIPGEIGASGGATIHALGTAVGLIATTPPEGDHSLVLERSNGTAISTTHFTVDRSVEIQSLGDRFFSDVGYFFVETEYPIDTASAVVINPAGVEISRFDPVTKSIGDIFGELPTNCIAPASGISAQQISSATANIATLTAQRRAAQAQSSVTLLENFVASGITPTCELPGTEFTTLEKYRTVATQRLTRYRVRENVPRGPAGVRGDLNADGKLDNADYLLIRSSLNKCTGQTGFVQAADMNSNGCVGYDDYQAWYAIYKQQ